MPSHIDVNIDWGLFEEAGHRATSRTVRAVAHEVKDEAQERIRGPVAAHLRDGEVVTDLVDTGAMLSSAYVVTGDGETERPSAISEASSRQPGIEIGVPDPTPNGDLEAQMNFAAGYAGAVEALYPFLDPAVEAVRPRVEEIGATEFAKEGL